MEAGKIQIGNIFASGCLLEVPFYQRGYVWGETEWSRFLEDMKFICSTKKPFFFGSIIFKNGEIPPTWECVASRKIVIDGQQRLTTLMLFMKVLAIKKNRVDLFDGMFRLDDKKIDFVHGKYDSAAFNAVMEKNTNEPFQISGKPSQIILAYNYFMKNIIPEDYNWTTIKADALFVCIDLNEGEDEQQIFDTINSPGISLSTSELLKNYFFNKDEADSYNENWVQVFERDEDCRTYWQQLVDVGRNKRALIDIFFDAFLQIMVSDRQYGIKTEDKIAYSRADRIAASYKDFIKRYCNGDRHGVIWQMATYAACFEKAIDPDAINMALPSEAGIERINVIIFGLTNTTLIPYVLYVEKNVPDEQNRRKIYAVLESYIMRRIVCHLSTKNYNRLFASLITNRILSAEALKTTLENAQNASDPSTRVPSDSEMKIAFHNEILVNLQTRGILYLLESSLHSSMSATMLLGFDRYSLEHLMPKKWRNNWQKLSSDEENAKRDRTLLTLGNLAIIPQDLNASVRDGNWQTKLEGKTGKAGLKKCAAGLDTMKDVLTQPKWDEQCISNRAEWLFNQAKEIWPFSIPDGTVPGGTPDPHEEPPEPQDTITAWDTVNKKWISVKTVGPRFITDRGGHAEGYRTNAFISNFDGKPAFVIMKGSKVAKEATNSAQAHLFKLRKDCAEILSETTINRNALFRTATEAAMFVCFGSANGNDMWKTEDGIRLGKVFHEN